VVVGGWEGNRFNLYHFTPGASGACLALVLLLEYNLNIDSAVYEDLLQ
jgi:hypothetical protein